MKKLLQSGFVVGVGLILVGCTTVKETGRRQLNLVSAGEEAKLGLNAFNEMKEQVPISKDAKANALVQKVGQRIAAVAGESLPDAQWEFVVFESKEANAFCLPGGKIGVYTGILPITKDEDGLATVIAHEVAHAAARHGAERMSQGVALQAGGQLVGGLTAGAQPITQTAVGALYGLGSQLGYSLPHSRLQESEADHIGLKYMVRAGYNPEAAVDFWQRFSEFNQSSKGSGTPWFLRTHPVDSKRIEDIRKWIPEVRREAGGQTGTARGSDVISK